MMLSVLPGSFFFPEKEVETIKYHQKNKYTKSSTQEMTRHFPPS